MKFDECPHCGADTEDEWMNMEMSMSGDEITHSKLECPSCGGDMTAEPDSDDSGPTHHPHLDAVLGKRPVAYHIGNDETLLRFEDGTILSWTGYRSLPNDIDEMGTREVVEDRTEGDWVHLDSDG